MEIHLPPDTEAKLRECAAAAGMKMEEFALEMIEESVTSEADEAAPKTSHAQWVQKLKACIELHPKTRHIVDDSRESIYEGRGD